jgi:DNA-binding MarR family transcriptional regulator
MTQEKQRHSVVDGLGFSLSRAALILQASVDEALKDLNITRPSWSVLACLYFDDITAPGDIARFLRMERTAVSRVISRLEAQGLVLRAQNAQDGRGYRLEVTQAGRDICEQGPALIQRAMRPHLRDLSENDVDLLISLLHRIGSDVVASWPTQRGQGAFAP